MRVGRRGCQPATSVARVRSVTRIEMVTGVWPGCGECSAHVAQFVLLAVFHVDGGNANVGRPVIRRSAQP